MDRQGSIALYSCMYIGTCLYRASFTSKNVILCSLLFLFNKILSTTSPCRFHTAGPTCVCIMKHLPVLPLP